MSDESRLTPERIDEVERMAREAKARADDATQEPWTAVPSDDAPAGHSVVFPNGEDVSVLSDEDAEFIASARDDVPALACAALELAAEVRRLHAHFAVVEKEQEHDGKIASKLKGLLKQAKAEHDELRAELERLRALDAEWQRVTGYGAPERFPGLTAEQREAGVERMRRWLENLPPSVAKIRDDLKRIEAEERAKREARTLSDLRRIHHADRDDEPADLSDRWQRRIERLSRGTYSATGAFERGYLRGVRDAYLVAGVEMRRARRACAVVPADAEQRPDVSPEAVEAEGAEVGACPNDDCPHDAWTMRGRTRCVCGAELVPAGRIVSAVDQLAGVDFGSAPATTGAVVLKRQPDGEFRALAAFEGPDAEQQARAFIATLPAEVAPAVDGRWLPGAEWEHRADHPTGPSRFTIDRLSSGESYAMFRGGDSELRANMTESNGWRYVEPEDDGRWSPGAVWEHRAGTSTIRLAVVPMEHPDGECVDLRGPHGIIVPERRSRMTADNGWRFIGRAGEPR